MLNEASLWPERGGETSCFTKRRQEVRSPHSLQEEKWEKWLVQRKSLQGCMTLKVPLRLEAQPIWGFTWVLVGTTCTVTCVHLGIAPHELRGNEPICVESKNTCCGSLWPAGLSQGWPPRSKLSTALRPEVRVTRVQSQERGAW